MLWIDVDDRGVVPMDVRSSGVPPPHPYHQHGCCAPAQQRKIQAIGNEVIPLASASLWKLSPGIDQGSGPFVFKL